MKTLKVTGALAATTVFISIKQTLMPRGLVTVTSK